MLINSTSNLWKSGAVMCGGYDVSSRTASEILSERRLEKVLQVIKIVICNWDIPPIEFLAIFFFFFFFEQGTGLLHHPRPGGPGDF